MRALVFCLVVLGAEAAYAHAHRPKPPPRTAMGLKEPRRTVVIAPSVLRATRPMVLRR